jgi:hypothetical protein
MGYIPWNRGAALTNREDRWSEFRKVIKTFDQAVSLAEEDSDRGRLHFWLGRFHGELMEYDSSAKHFEMAKALRAFPVECSPVSGNGAHRAGVLRSGGKTFTRRAPGDF